MWEVLINAFVSVCSITGGVMFMRGRYRVEVDKLRAEVESMKTQTRDAEINLIANASQVLINNIVTPLENELSKMRETVSSLQRAIQQIYNCRFVADCPVRKQLHHPEKSDRNQPPGTATN